MRDVPPRLSAKAVVDEIQTVELTAHLGDRGRPSVVRDVHCEARVRLGLDRRQCRSEEVGLPGGDHDGELMHGKNVRRQDGGVNAERADYT